MRVIDLDAIDWTKAPVEFADYVSIEAMKQWLSAQEGPVVMVLTNSKNPLLRAKAQETNADLYRLFINIAKLIGTQNALNEMEGRNDTGR